MKKVFAVMLCLALALSCAAAVAETEEKERLGSLDVSVSFTLLCNLPEGYQINVLKEDGMRLQAAITPVDPAKPHMFLSICYDDMFADVFRMNDMSAEDKAMLEETFGLEDSVEISYVTTSLGTEMMMVKENDGAADYVDFMTVYQGYDVEFLLYPAQGTELTDEQIAMAITFLSDLDFVAMEAPEEAAE